MMRFEIIVSSVLLLCLQLASAQTPPPGTVCPPKSGKPTCVCDHPNGTLDLTSLANDAGTTPKWSGLPVDNWKFSFNPCYAFSELTCSNVHVCQESVDQQESYAIANEGTEQIYIDPTATDPEKRLYLFYTGPADDPSDPRVTFVYLICDQSQTTPQVTALGEPEQQIHYVFTVRAKEACIGGGGGTAGVAAGIVGVVLIVLLIVGIVLYFVIGAVIMKMKYEATGTDIIPNKHFWKELPILIKDGVLFTFSPCTGAIQQRRGKGEYSSI